MNFYDRLAFRIVLLNTLIVVLTIAGFGYATWQREHRAIEERFGERLQHVVATAALHIDGDAHKTMRSKDQASQPEYIELQRFLREVQEANDLNEDLLYTFHYEPNSTPRMGVSLHEQSYAGDTYPAPTQNIAFLDSVVSTLNSTHSQLYQDSHGQWVSGYAPILDSQGQIAGILEADYNLKHVNMALEGELRALLGMSSLSILLAFVLSSLLGAHLNRSLNSIREGAEAIERGDYDHRVHLDSKDELGLVATRFNQMAAVLAERFFLLKFLPKHTLTAVARRVADGVMVETERVEASIFFSDIRGYTEMSEGLSDERVVEMLNTYLRRQAEVLSDHGGSIDKFIGDAVLGVFSGDDHCAAAIAAALEIQDEIARMNAEQLFDSPVHVGIGIACGSMVLAELGSADRKERTLIGSVVNLASRLCSQAGAGEVVISDEARHDLGARVDLSGTEQVELKGFRQQQAIHRVRAVRSSED